MSGKFFLDTNILVYTFDSSSTKKRSIARDLVRKALTEGQGVISWQVVQEFFNVATRKFTVPLSVSDCREYLDEVLSPLCEVYPDVTLFRSALTLQTTTNFRFYDSLVVAAAQRAGCRTLYSEDLQSGRILSRLTIMNPFA